LYWGGIQDDARCEVRAASGREVERLTGNRMVPALVLDDGTVVDGSREIVAWAQRSAT
jgi:glutathione S-transferase